MVHLRVAFGMLKLLIACVLLILLCGTVDTYRGAEATKTQTIVKTFHINRPKQNDSRYYYVPFEVRPNTQKISISYSYDRANGSNAVDIGLFDSRASLRAGDVTGFRGWSGGRRVEFFVSRETATPGYVPGEMPEGTWHIILGLYRVVSSGVDITFKIDVETDESKATNLAKTTPLSQLFTPFHKRLAKSEATPRSRHQASLLWVTGDLHLHTVHSDGDRTVSELIRTATDAGLDFICITDHNTSSHHTEINNFKPSHLLVIRGEEITTYGGHANAWGLPANALIDFRVEPGDQKAMSRVVSQAHRSGALISINHPFALCPGCDWSYGKAAVGFDAIEVWNGSWDASDERALTFWDQLLQRGRRITAIGSSDSHRADNPIGQAATHVAIDGTLSSSALLSSIRAGRVYLTSTPKAPTITVECQKTTDRKKYFVGDVIRIRTGDHLRFRIVLGDLSMLAKVTVISGGQIIQTFQPASEGEEYYVDVQPSKASYYRIEVRGQDGTMLGLTNPIYITKG